ncbi:hypothetical protein OEZ85_008839 [Tetradesmus obliquus]|uniref:C3H1-type domain-containing protein n=1 Tax=Tetradesmus obliquus TaxID=3088 RepID=A0ABY8TJZ6_TETOB|nr:hypothetical protein OEZ85_008839 [Tetradesmus obliquus]
MPRTYSNDDTYMMYTYKVRLCTRTDSHSWKHCPWRHLGETAAQRRHPSMHRPVMCTNLRLAGECPDGDSCPFSHNAFELSLHPERYKTTLCNLGGKCDRDICFFAHSEKDLRTAEPAAPPPSGSQAAGSSAQAAALQAAGGVWQSSGSSALAAAAMHSAELSSSSYLSPMAHSGGGGGSGGLMSRVFAGRGAAISNASGGMEQLQDQALMMRQDLCKFDSFTSQGAAPAHVPGQLFYFVMLDVSNKWGVC